MYFDALLSAHPIITDQVDKSELHVILRELEQVILSETSGDIVELGCYEGTTSLFIQRLLTAHESKRSFHVYDSFEGLPEKQNKDASPTGTQFVPGALRASKATLIRNFKKALLPLPYIHKGWFDRLNTADIPDHIAFAFLDGDYYESIHTSLRLIWPRLSRGAVVVIDDYHNQALPGAAKAVDEWILNRSLKNFSVQASLAILRT